MNEVKNSLETGDNVYLRGFGSFIVKLELKKEEIFPKIQQ
jgi:DNA-binding protein HU-beta